jgi:pimeloyl-ACP methyl ester carboxylesterase
VRGGESEILTCELADRMIRTMPNAREVVIPRAGHAVHEDNASATIETYAEFFRVPLD